MGSSFFVEPACIEEMNKLLGSEDVEEKNYDNLILQIMEHNYDFNFKFNGIKEIKANTAHLLLNSATNQLINVSRNLNNKTSNINQVQEYGDPENQIKVQSNNLMKLSYHLFDFLDAECLWKQKSTEAPIAIKLYESCTVLLFGDYYTVYCDRTLPLPKLPINLNMQTVWRRPENNYDELTDAYVILLENRVNVLKFMGKLMKKCQIANSINSNPIASLFSHRFSKNIINFFHSATFMLYSESHALMRTEYASTFTSLKQHCANIISKLLANSFLEMADNPKNQLVKAYFDQKKSLLQLPQEFNEDLTNPFNYPLRIISNYKYEIIQAILIYCSCKIPTNNFNSFTYSGKEKEYEEEMVKHTEDSNSMLNLFYINTLLLSYNKFSRIFLVSNFLVCMFEDALFFMLFNNVNKFKIPTNAICSYLAYSISFLREPCIRLVLPSKRYISQIHPSKGVNTPVALLIILIKRLIKYKEPNNNQLQLLIACLYNM